jgi:hypothetical protein
MCPEIPDIPVCKIAPQSTKWELQRTIRRRLPAHSASIG